MADDAITAAHRSGDLKTAFLWTAGRTLELWAGMRMAGEEHKVFERALAGSVAVQAVITGWMLYAKNRPDVKLPSIEAIQRRDLFGLAATYVLRSTIVGIGMVIAGFRDNVIRNALAGGAVIEASVIAFNLREMEQT